MYLCLFRVVDTNVCAFALQIQISCVNNAYRLSVHYNYNYNDFFSKFSNKIEGKKMRLVEAIINYNERQAQRALSILISSCKKKNLKKTNKYQYRHAATKYAWASTTTTKWQTHWRKVWNETKIRCRCDACSPEHNLESSRVATTSAIVRIVYT